MTGPRVLVAGALANKPHNGGEAWVRLSWVRALEELGGDVAFVERLAPGHHDPSALTWFEAVTERFGLAGRAWLVPADGTARAGGALPTGDAAVLVGDAGALRRRLGSTDLLVDISGNLTGWAGADGVPCRVHVDIDPGYTQVWAAQGLVDLSWHHVHATVGTAMGSPSCAFPTGGVDWVAIRQPVSLRDWEVAPSAPAGAAFTTVSSWRGAYGPLEWNGRTFGVKAHRFRRLSPIARNSPVPLEIAVRIDPADRADADSLRSDGWRVVDPADVAATPESFAAYVTASRGELSVAHPVYAEGRTGWFSDRTVRYLAAGRPAVVEDTGWCDDLPHGRGLLGFRDEDAAVAGIEAVLADPDGHATAARAIAEEYFTPTAALAGLLSAVGWPR